jgi:hypothetical protein
VNQPEVVPTCGPSCSGELLNVRITSRRSAPADFSGTRTLAGPALKAAAAHANSSSNDFASFRFDTPKPSVNQL